MKLKNSYFYTLREDAKDEESKSGNLLVRSGMIKKVGAGLYMYLPFGLKVLDKIRGIVKEEMDNAGAQELLMPSLIPSEYYETCGRVEAFGKDMFNLKDRYDKPFVLGPTHEELFTIAAKAMVKSYKDLPFTIYQQADKFRDEPRPRYGLIRVREFIMKDAYSFDRDENSLEESYNKMKVAYNKIYDRLGIDYKIVRSDTGAMGGSLSEEYQAITDIGEDVIVLCKDCEYASNLEVSECITTKDDSLEKELELVETPHQETIEDVCKYLNISSQNSVKALLMNVNEELVIFFVRGDRELNENKACKLLGCKEINFADDALIATSNAVPGYTGPINLNAKIVIDIEILNMKNFCCGGNKEGYHYINANVKDFKYDVVGDIVNVVEGDICPNCGGKLYFKKGIEIGNLFKLGTKYAESLGLNYLDENNNLQTVTMGCYGIGVGRILASIIEQNNDESGMILPMSIAPFQVSIVLIDSKDEKQVEASERIYNELKSAGIDVLLDNRDERPGIKFKDMDLIGIPFRITIGKKVNDGIVEIKERSSKEFKEINENEVVNYTIQYVKDNLK
ncbi:MAG: proline--tRNA ligase [Bacilli bacterium]|nr:proline--tRNA ligase [Bacilli bacterium]